MEKIYAILISIAAIPLLLQLSAPAAEPVELAAARTWMDGIVLPEPVAETVVVEEIPITEVTEDAKEVPPIPEEPTYDNTMILVGAGGESSYAFHYAALTYQKAHGGEIYEVNSGDEGVRAINDFVAAHGPIGHLEYFGHGNEVALFLNQTPGENGALYTNDPALDADYIAASIYELDQDIFADGANAKFNGCSIAMGYPYNDSFAEKFANYFGITVKAPNGPMEFIEDGETVYMVLTYDDREFVDIPPAAASTSGYSDVKQNELYEEAVRTLTSKGLNLGSTDLFKPYQVITYADAKVFCTVAVGDASKCTLSGFNDADELRNLRALQMLVNAYGVQLASSSTWYSPYVHWASDTGNLLTENFTDRVTYTRGEMAMLTYNFMKHFAN
jgi:hypothetical protein